MSSAALVARARGHSAEFGRLPRQPPADGAWWSWTGWALPPSGRSAWFETYAAANGLAAGARGRRPGRCRQLAGPPRPARARGRLSRLLPAEVRRLGAEEALRRYLPVLVPGIAASALHALMRLAYGYLTATRPRSAPRSATGPRTWLPLRPADAVAPATDDPAALLTRLARASGAVPRRAADRPAVALDAGGRGRARRSRTWRPLLGPAPDLLARVAKASLALMAGTMTFEAVHAVTSAHWLRILRPVWPDEALAGPLRLAGDRGRLSRRSGRRRCPRTTGWRRSAGSPAPTGRRSGRRRSPRTTSTT